ncbi:CynX/NimT family MFS transporter [Nitrospirillum sp. BR 11163]|uniref:MFS transporter n=1 Tax=Nitrospirillum sp. BR 11163 TaxID=3104323 RepID=UPI002AFEB866|nr:MFS transporter [Nitrospirillum sp. BR 11163]MEA1672116.1 MFS transporter [Nitrospirillum sp. BR 11163]
MRREWLVLAAVSLSFFFLNAATFASLGVVLYTMVGELHWSFKAAGFSFSLLGIACGLSSVFPTTLMKRIGPRYTMTLGGLVLVVAYMLASYTHGLLAFYAAMLLLGLGYSLTGNVPAIYAIACWFPRRSARMIGLYLMIGAFGGVVGPPLARAIVSFSADWRVYWMEMAGVAVAVTLINLLCLRDRAIEAEAPAVADRAPVSPAEATATGWTYRSAIATPQFLAVAASMTMTMACVTTINSVALNHLGILGVAPDTAAFALAAMALVMTVAKGVAGPLCEIMSTRRLLVLGLALQVVGIALFAHAGTLVGIGAFAVAFGIGWGVAYLAASVLLLEYFGKDIGSQVLGMVWTITTVAAAGPVAAGAIADQIGTFAPIFYLYAVLMVAAIVPLALLGRPVLAGAGPFARRAAAPDDGSQGTAVQVPVS